MKFWKYIYTALILIILSLIVALSQIPDDNLHIIACDVGQGDAILITYKSIQILTDGGPDKSVMDCLGKYIPFWDRQIELVVSTHPDADHSSGLVDVVENYKVDKILINSLDPGTEVYKALKNVIGGGGVEVINPMYGMKLRLDMIYLDILNPTEDLLSDLTIVHDGDNLSKFDGSKVTNLYSIVYLLRFGKFEGLFMGDAPPDISDRLATEKFADTLEYIKIPHHGSVNGLTENLLKAFVPKIAVISVGKNPWGFPRPEILGILDKYGVKTLRTDLMGDIEFVTDGERYWVE